MRKHQPQPFCACHNQGPERTRQGWSREQCRRKKQETRQGDIGPHKAQMAGLRGRWQDKKRRAGFLLPAHLQASFHAGQDPHAQRPLFWRPLSLTPNPSQARQKAESGTYTSEGRRLQARESLPARAESKGGAEFGPPGWRQMKKTHPDAFGCRAGLSRGVHLVLPYVKCRPGDTNASGSNLQINLWYNNYFATDGNTAPAYFFFMKSASSGLMRAS